MVDAGDTGNSTRYLDAYNPAQDAIKSYDLGAVNGNGFFGFGNGNDNPQEPDGATTLWPYYASADTLTIALTTSGAGGTTGRATIIVFFVPLPATAITAVKS